MDQHIAPQRIGAYDLAMPLEGVRGELCRTVFLGAPMLDIGLLKRWRRATYALCNLV